MRDDSAGQSEKFLQPPQVQQMREPMDADWNVTLRTCEAGCCQTDQAIVRDLTNLIDFSLMNEIFANFLEVVGLPAAIIDLNGHVLASSKWQRICTDFHRVNSKTQARCIEADVSLSRSMADNKDCAIYRCNNGLTDCAAPIVVEGIHVANLFVGQFLLAAPDTAFFEQQQKQFSFDREAYFAALSEVPIVSEQRLPAILRLVTNLARQITSQSLAEKRAREAQAVSEKEAILRAEELTESNLQFAKLKKTEAALAESQGLLRSIIDTLPLRVFWKDRNLRFLGCNSAFAHDAGMTLPDELVGKDDRQMPWRDQADLYRADDLAVMESGVPRLFYEEPLTKPDGQVIWLRTSKVPLKNNDDETIGVLGIYEDITECKKIDEERRWLSEAVRQCSAAIIVADTSNRVVYVNPAYEWLFGYSIAELKGRDLSLLLPDDPILRQANPVESGFFEGEKIRRTKDGKNIDVLVKTAPIVDGSGLEVGFVSAKTDLTELKQAELKAEAASRAKSDFLANMSHEIRTPMNGIIGMAHLALMCNLEPKAHGYVEDIGRSAQRLLGIINDILDVSKIEADQLLIEQIPFDLPSLVDDTVAMVRNAAEAKGLAITLQIDPAVPHGLIGDPLRVGQVLLNYLNNAVKFTEHGEISVGVEAVEASEAGTTLRFAVSDTGIGLAPEHQGDLFEPFHQAEITVARKFGGTGLGLAIARQLAGLMGGKVGVESTQGSGSTFWFTIRVGVSVEGHGASPISREPLRHLEAGVNDHSLLRGTRVLLAEDDLTNQMVAIGLLEAVGMEVDVVGDGDAAVKRVRENDYEIVLMDMRMPTMDGVTATRLIREREDLADLPIVAMTANAMSSQQEECLAAGMNDFIGKPFDPSQLYAVIQKWVTGLGDAALFAPSAMAAMKGANLRLPGHIAGLDIRAGLRRVAGMKALYVNTLQSFVDGQEDIVARVRQAIADHDTDRAGREAHTLKGLAGMIEAGEVCSLAAELETTLAVSNLASVPQLLDRLEMKLVTVVGAIRAAVEGSRAKSSA
jgi:PAS domain S-box-containing protein